MKKAIQKSFTFLGMLTFSIVFGYGILYAWNGLTASSGDNLTAAKWNELVSKVSGIYTDSSGNVGIGIIPTHPGRKLEVTETTPSTMNDLLLRSDSGLVSITLDADYSNLSTNADSGITSKRVERG